MWPHAHTPCRRSHLGNRRSDATCRKLTAPKTLVRSHRPLGRSRLGISREPLAHYIVEPAGPDLDVSSLDRGAVNLNPDPQLLAKSHMIVANLNASAAVRVTASYSASSLHRERRCQLNSNQDRHAAVVKAPVLVPVRNVGPVDTTVMANFCAAWSPYRRSLPMPCRARLQDGIEAVSIDS